jgi:hypothetical protein
MDKLFWCDALMKTRMDSTPRVGRNCAERLWGLRAEARATRVPAEVMQLFIVAGGKPWADELAIRGGVRLDANDADGVSLPTLARR